MLYIPIILSVGLPGGGFSVIDDIKLMFITMFNVMQQNISAGDVSFTLMDVFFAGGIMLLTGDVIATLFFWTKNRR